jgi:exodeoxyribonuclease V beta subunit
MSGGHRIARFDPLACPLDGAHVVEASAGTGKTYSLSWVAARLVVERAAPLDEILVVTFTNAATAELKAAVRDRLKGLLAALERGGEGSDEQCRAYAASLGDPVRAAELARAALAEFDRAAISSIHGFCKRILDEHAFESGVPFDHALLEDDGGFARQIADDFWARETYTASISRVEELAAAGFGVARARGIVELLVRDPEVRLIHSTDPISREVEVRLAAYVRETAAYRRRETGALSFNDLLYELDRALADGPRGARLTERLRGRYRAGLVDEFQDTNGVQYRIFRRIFAGGRTFFTFGDPKQAIYGFRGGDVFAYLGATSDAGVARWSLDVNYRADEGVVRAVNALFEGVADPFACRGRIAYRPARARPEAAGRMPLTGAGVPLPPCEILYHEPGGAAVRDTHLHVAADIARLLASGARIARPKEGGSGVLGDAGERVSARDVAVLTRTNAQTKPLAEALRAHGIMSLTTSEESVFATDEARILAALLDGVAHPGDAAKVATALSSPLFGLAAEEIRGVAHGDERYSAWAARMEALGRAFERGGTIGLVNAALGLDRDGRGGRVAASLFALPGGDRIASRVRHVAELVQVGAPAETRDAADAARWIAAKIGRRDPATAAEQVRKENDGDAVRLMTIHKAKGLEFPIVYVPYFSRSSKQKAGARPAAFHDPEAGDAPSADLGSERAAEHARLAQEEAAAEEVRLLYVAVTRARHLVKLVWWPQKDGHRGTADRLLRAYAVHLPDGVAPRTEEEDALAAIGAAAGGKIGIARLSRAEPVVEIPRLARERVVLVPPPDRVAIPAPAAASSFTALVDGGIAREVAATGDEPGDDPEERVPLAKFPAGREAGTLIHEILERADLSSSDGAKLERIAAASLSRRGLDPGEWKRVVAGALAEAFAAPLDGSPGSRLCDVAAACCLKELRFVLHQRRSGDASGPTPAGIAEALAAASDPWGARCAERARALDFAPFAGNVAGAVDLVFARGGRWYLADYKTNHLGPRYEDYGCAALERVMLDHHYYLQYHLYALALHRYLGSRLRGYDYDAHFGGVYYLFLRGMSAARGPRSGVYFTRPERLAVEALDAAFGAREGCAP